MYDESKLLARKTYAGATSSGWPARFIGTSEPNWLTLLSGKLEGISGVQIGPAQQIKRHDFARSIRKRPVSRCAQITVRDEPVPGATAFTLCRIGAKKRRERKVRARSE